MDKLKKLSLGEKILGGAGIFLLLDMLFLPWHKVEISFLGFSESESRSAIQSPNAFLGLLALLLAAALVAHVIVSEFSQIKLPKLPVSWARADLLAAAAVAGLLVVKLVMETDFLAFGAWLAILAAAALVYGGWRRDREDHQAGSHAPGPAPA